MDAMGKLSYLNHGEPIISAEDLPNPSYLCILESIDSTDSRINNRPPSLRHGGLCIVSELLEGKFQSFAVQTKTTENGELEIRATAVGEALNTGGSWPCHIVSTNVGDEMESVIICNYGQEEGVLSVFGFHKGSLTNMYSKQTSISFGSGSNVDLDRQSASHAHSVSVIPSLSHSSSMTMCCADLGSDAIVQLTLITENSTASNDGQVSSFQYIEIDRLAAPPGSGPRSLMFNPIFPNVAIVSLEMTAQVWLIQRRVEDGQFIPLCDPVSLLPENWPTETELEYQFNHGRWASDAVWSPCGKFVYAAARLHNSISVFEIQLSPASKDCSSASNYADINGLKLVQRITTNGLTPRCLCTSECGQFILVAHHHSHDITSFQRHETNGTITIVDRIEAPNAACLKLVRPDRMG